MYFLSKYLMILDFPLSKYEWLSKAIKDNKIGLNLLSFETNIGNKQDIKILKKDIKRDSSCNKYSKNDPD